MLTRLALWLGLPHWYVSTGCLHGTPQGHAYCRLATGLSGAKTPGVCKHCGAKCRCRCHRRKPAAPQPRLTIQTFKGGGYGAA